MFHFCKKQYWQKDVSRDSRYHHIYSLVRNINKKTVGEWKSGAHILKVVEVSLHYNLMVNGINPNGNVTLFIRFGNQKRLRDIKTVMY